MLEQQWTPETETQQPQQLADPVTSSGGTISRPVSAHAQRMVSSPSPLPREKPYTRRKSSTPKSFTNAHELAVWENKKRNANLTDGSGNDSPIIQMTLIPMVQDYLPMLPPQAKSSPPPPPPPLPSSLPWSVSVGAEGLPPSAWGVPAPIPPGSSHTEIFAPQWYAPAQAVQTPGEPWYYGASPRSYSLEMPLPLPLPLGPNEMTFPDAHNASYIGGGVHATQAHQAHHVHAQAHARAQAQAQAHAHAHHAYQPPPHHFIHPASASTAPGHPLQPLDTAELSPDAVLGLSLDPLTASPATTSPVTPQLVDHVPFGYYAYPQ